MRRLSLAVVAFCCVATAARASFLAQCIAGESPRLYGAADRVCVPLMATGRADAYDEYVACHNGETPRLFGGHVIELCKALIVGGSTYSCYADCYASLAALRWYSARILQTCRDTCLKTARAKARHL